MVTEAFWTKNGQIRSFLLKRYRIVSGFIEIGFDSLSKPPIRLRYRQKFSAASPVKLRDNAICTLMEGYGGI